MALKTSLPRPLHTLKREQPATSRARGFARYLPLLAALLLLPATPAQASMVEAVQDFLFQEAGLEGQEAWIEVRAPAAQFPPCAEPRPFLPRADSKPLLGRVSVGLRCGADGQARYLSAHIRVIGDYLELSRALAPGEAITEGLLETRRGDLSELPADVLRRPAQALGLVARHRLAAGTVLREQQLLAPAVVAAGEAVTVESRGQGFVARRDGQALERGGIGDSVRVRLSRSQVVRGRVAGPGLIQVSGR